MFFFLNVNIKSNFLRFIYFRFLCPTKKNYIKKTYELKFVDNTHIYIFIDKIYYNIKGSTNKCSLYTCTGINFMVDITSLS